MAEITSPSNQQSPIATNMAEISSKTTFHDLPLEMRQNVYLVAATDSTGKQEIMVKFTLSKENTDGSGEFDAPVLDLLDSLQQVSSELHQEAVAYLISSLFCWVLVSKEQPHKYLLRALRKHPQGCVLSKIGHVRLEGVSVLGITHPGASVIDFQSTSVPECFAHSGLKFTKELDATELKLRVTHDIGYGYSLLPFIIKSLRRLDIDFDAIESLYGYLDMAQYFIRDLKYSLISPGSTRTESAIWSVILQLITLGDIRKADQVDVRIFWKDTGLRERMPNRSFGEDDVLALQQILMDYLKRKLVVKSISDHL